MYGLLGRRPEEGEVGSRGMLFYVGGRHSSVTGRRFGVPLGLWLADRVVRKTLAMLASVVLHRDVGGGWTSRSRRRYEYL